jgi:hypothetical protein
MQGKDEPLATKSNWATTFDDQKDAKAPTVKLIALQSHIIAIKCHSNCNEACVFATAIATNALVKDFCVVIEGSNVNMVVPPNNQLC